MAEHAGEAVGIVPVALRHRDFHLFWGGVMLSGLGSQVTTVAVVWQMYELTNSAWQIGLLGLVPTPRRAGRWVLVAVALYGVCTMLFTVSTPFWLALLLAGAGNMVGGVLRNTINQVLTPDHCRGRVAAVNSIFTMGGPHWGSLSLASWPPCGVQRPPP